MAPEQQVPEIRGTPVILFDRRKVKFGCSFSEAGRSNGSSRCSMSCKQNYMCEHLDCKSDCCQGQIMVLPSLSVEQFAAMQVEQEQVVAQQGVVQAGLGCQLVASQCDDGEEAAHEAHQVIAGLIPSATQVPRVQPLTSLTVGLFIGKKECTYRHVTLQHGGQVCCCAAPRNAAASSCVMQAEPFQHMKWILCSV